MKRSSNRILTTHAGRLNGPASSTEDARHPERPLYGPREPQAGIKAAMAGVIKQQEDAGIDILSDGELGKIGSADLLRHAHERPQRRGPCAKAKPTSCPTAPTSAVSSRSSTPAQRRGGGVGAGSPANRNVVSGDIKYIGQKEAEWDIQLFNESLKASGRKVRRSFMCVLAPGWIEHLLLERVLQRRRGVPVRHRRRDASRSTRPSSTPASCCRSTTRAARHLRHDRAASRASRSTASSPSCASRR